MKTSRNRNRATRRLFVIISAASALTVTAGVSLFLLGGDGEETKNREEKLCWSLVPAKSHNSTGSLKDCGDALEVAMTGSPAGQKKPDDDGMLGSKHAAVTEKVVKTYADSKTAAIPSEIRANLANALTYYSSDIHDILSIQADFSSPEFSTKPNDLDIERSEVSGFTASIARDSKAFDVVYDAQMRHVAHEVNTLTRAELTRKPSGNTDRARGVARAAGASAGTLYGARIAGGNKETDTISSRYGWPHLEKLLRARCNQLDAPIDSERVQEIYSLARSSFNDWD
ncbi:hypothetical protein [Streptomyces sp. NPDC048142]|uniref:hypothetical protein n=1 Tax=Streptomyces sp. NPDC048142 TaxID=3365501 RepID=UPI0037114071